MNERGVFARSKNSEDDPSSKVWICDQLLITATICDEQGGNHGRIVEWTDHIGHHHQWAMPLELLAVDDREVRRKLMNGGLAIAFNDSARKLLPMYLLASKPAEHLTGTTTVGWHGDNSFVLPGRTFGRQGIVLPDTETNFRSAGTLEEWQQHVAQLAVGNSRLLLVMSGGFAAPLLEPLNVEPAGFHLQSQSSTGKTTALHAGGSVSGGGGKHGFLQTWNTTKNGLEAVLAAHNDTGLYLDEIGELDANEVNKVAYMAINGAGRRRLTANIELRRSFDWRVLLFSSGEITLAEHAESAGQRTRGGVETRILNIRADAGKAFGLWEDLHGVDSAEHFSDQLKTASLTHYGVALPAFLERLVAFPRAELRKRWDEHRRNFAINIPPDATGEVKRAAKRFCLVGFAGELATEWGIVPLQLGQATWGATRCFLDWLDAHGTSSGFDVARAIRGVRLFIERNGSSRFQSTRVEVRSVPADEHGTDQITLAPRVVVNRAGYRHEGEDGLIVEYWVFPEVFRTEVCEGFDPAAVAAELHRRGALTKSEGDRWTVKHTVPQTKERLPFYVIKPRILEQE